MDMHSISILMGGQYRCTPAWQSPSSFADCHRFYFPFKGWAEFRYADRVWRLEPGFVYFLPGYQWVSYGCRRRMDLYWLHVRPDAVELDLAFAAAKPGIRWSARDWSYWKPVYARIGEYFERRSDELEYRMQAMLQWAAAEMLLRAKRAPASATHSGKGASPSLLETLRPALEYMDRRVEANLSLDEIAAHVHLSPIYFHRSFKRALHVTPRVYLLRKRMHLAWNLLRAGHAVNAVAERLHFGTAFYFSLAFKTFFGIPPNQVKMGRTKGRP